MMFCAHIPRSQVSLPLEIPPIWLLAYPRTGSEYLRGLLQGMRARGLLQTRVFPYRVFAHLKAEFRYGFVHYPHEYAYSKVLRCDFVKHGMTDRDKNNIESKLPGLRYISLKRRNVFETAVSLYFAKLTGVWRLKKGRSIDYLDTKIEYNEGHLLDCYRECKDKYHCWDNYLLNTPHVEVVYEDLLHDPVDALRRIVDFMEIPIPNDTTHLQEIVNRNRRQKMTRSETPEYIEKLKKLVENHAL